MNAFLEHQQQAIRFAYSGFDRILLNAIIQVLQNPAAVAGFLKEKRLASQLTPAYFRVISTDYHHFVQALAEQRQVEIVVPPKDGRREEWVEPFYQRLPGQDGIAVILKSRENARVAVSYPRCGNHIELANRFVWQYYFYLQDPDFGRMFLRICPYFPFNARICLNGHEWLACRLHAEGIGFRQCGNAFRTCADPARLQGLADRFSPADIEACAHRWLAQLVPFFTDRERRRQGFGYRLFVSQVEYCTNLVFERRAALDRLHERLLDLNRTIGHPDKIALIFGRRITQHTDAGLKTQILDHGLGQPVIRSEYKSSSIKQYVRDHLVLRTETTSYHTPDLGVNKGVEQLPELRQTMAASNDRYLEVQQDVLETFVDRGQLERLRQATVSPSGRRTPGLKLDDPRLLAVLQALTCFAFLAGRGCFRTTDLHRAAAETLGKTTESYTLGQLRYDLAKLRGKGLVERIAGTQTYRLPPGGYRIAVLYLKLFHRIYAPLTAGILDPVPWDDRLPPERRASLDRLYVAVDRALNHLFESVGVRLAG
jgi:GNAT superfamily N-acetyltransferase